ncbi:cytohesin-1 isoform X2 [Balearica regulorum gibbericeps]|uniref:cytohesin-1 isoform X2 n=1 Tax=Balearica regulorum gibbericeps TaxID=100784 RepID=UPI003F6361BE
MEEEEGGYVPSDLTPEECQELENIRRRKQELLADIQRLKDEIAEVTNEIENLGSTEERKNMQRNKQVAMGRKKFNMDPKKGIQFLIENDLLKNTCEDIAQFLYKGEGLNKTAIGDYLGERDEFNIQVLHAFVELHEFTDLNLVQALRQFLWSFRLPGEAQKIDRMMEAFAQRYCQCNPGVFQSTDTCYVLSFAIIMLNTSLHNPNVKDKPTAERFIAMNRGINDGGDLPEELLRNLYESIKNEPFKIPEDDGNDLTHTFFNPDREGWLLKLGADSQLTRPCSAAAGWASWGILPLGWASPRAQSRYQGPVSEHGDHKTLLVTESQQGPVGAGPRERAASCPRLRASPPSMPQTSPCLTFPQHYHLRIPAPHAGSVHGIPAAPLHSPALAAGEPAPTPWLLWLLLSAALGNPLPRLSEGGQWGAGRSGVWWGPFPGALAGVRTLLSPGGCFCRVATPQNGREALPPTPCPDWCRAQSWG